MARPTQYQKLSLQLDAENQKLKSKLQQTQTQLRGMKSSAGELRKGFSDSFDGIGGAAGNLKGQFDGLLSKITSLHPGVLALGAAGGTLALAFQDLTSYTQTWEGALSDAGRELASVQSGFKSFFKLASEQRGKAFAEGGLFGWISEATSQLIGLSNGSTTAALAVQTGVASIVNDAMLTWQKGLLETTVQTRELRAQTQELYNQFRNNQLLPEDRLDAVQLYKERALELYEIQKNNAENELKYLLESSKLSGNSFEDNLKIEEKKAEIADLEREYHKLIGRTIEYENTITAQLDKQLALKRQQISIPEAEGKGVKSGDAMQIASKKMLKGVTEELMQVESQRTSQSISENRTLANELSEIRSGSIKGLMQEGIVAAVSHALRDVPFPFNLIAATGAGVAAQTIFNKLPSFDVGTDYVPRDMLAMIHKGEAIIPAAQNKGGTLQAVVRGQDLHFVLQEYGRRRSASY